uniref:DUF7351 domain-containing protein n=1 Tax=Haloarcula regularis TaxID=3033392 RepID=UPI0023E8356B|nr:hypothetical protein [Halomicroarcula sp. SYNS111]
MRSGTPSATRSPFRPYSGGSASETAGSSTTTSRKLVGKFVGRTDDEYELLYPGHRVIDAVRSGVLHRTVAVDPVTLETPCAGCGDPLSFTYDGQNHLGRVGCLDCEDIVVAFPFDPGGIQGRSDEAVVEAFDRRTRLFWRFALAGVCPVCAGVVEAGLTAAVGPELPTHYTDDHPVTLHVDCRGCSFYNYPPLAAVVGFHPAVAGWLHDRGVDPRTTPVWAFDGVRDPDQLDVLSEDPWAVAVPVRAGDETLRVHLDGALAVTALERRPAGASDGL